MALSTTAVPAFGATLAMCTDANGTSPTTIAEVKDFSFNFTTATEEATTHNTGTPYRTFIATLHSTGVEFMVNFVGDGATHEGEATGFLFVQKSRVERTFVLTPSDGSNAFQFNGLITASKIDHPVAGIRSGSITIQGSGVVDFDA